MLLFPFLVCHFPYNGSFGLLEQSFLLCLHVGRNLLFLETLSLALAGWHFSVVLVSVVGMVVGQVRLGLLHQCCHFWIVVEAETLGHDLFVVQ